jgi:hypothetical protein
MHGVGDQKQRITTRIEAQPSVAQGTAGYAFPWEKKAGARPLQLRWFGPEVGHRTRAAHSF